jgi:transcriptional regulator with XRE-family HTH domain
LDTRQTTVELFRERLLEVIARSGLNRSAFAQRAGIDRSTLSQILSPSGDRLPRVETLAAIATTAQVSVDWLIGLSEEGALGTDILKQSIGIERRARSPIDERLAGWHEEALGYRIRHVPTTLPDLVKTEALIEYEYRDAVVASPEQRMEMVGERLAYQRRPGTEFEVCSSLQSLEVFARGEGIWRTLAVRKRRAQLKHMIALLDELYPRFRWFLYDGLQVFSVPLTIFGPKRAALYLGQMYMVINSAEHIRTLGAHFDELIRAAVVQPPDVPEVLRKLLESG